MPTAGVDAASIQGLDGYLQEERGCRIDTPHAQEVRSAVGSLARSYGWQVDSEVEEALAKVDLPSYRMLLDRQRQAEPCWDEAIHGAFCGDARVEHLAAGGYVFEDLSVYAVLAQLLYPAIARGGRPPRVLDVGCGTGFLTSVLAQLAAARGGSVTAIDVFAQQVAHARRTVAASWPQLAPLVAFEVANGWEYRDPAGAQFTAVAVAAQAPEVPQALLEQLAPGGRLVLPLNRPVPIDSGEADTFQRYWLVERGPDGDIAFSGRAGPIAVNFLPLLPPSSRPNPPQ